MAGRGAGRLLAESNPSRATQERSSARPLLRQYDAKVVSANALKLPRPIGQISIEKESGTVALSGRTSGVAKRIPEYWPSHWNKHFQLGDNVSAKVGQSLGKSGTWHQQMRLVIAEADAFGLITIFDFLLCFSDHKEYFLSDMRQSEEQNCAKAFPHFRISGYEGEIKGKNLKKQKGMTRE
jgi:hypothetical protein